MAGRPANIPARIQIFKAVAAGGAVQYRTAPRIAKRTNLSLSTVNNHLRFLEANGAIERTGEEASPGRGRPSVEWGLTGLGEFLKLYR
jgi:predicted ArsR family transcriptional regulator